MTFTANYTTKDKLAFLLPLFAYIMVFAGCGDRHSKAIDVDEQGKAIQYANVALLQANDSAFIKGVVSDATGRFSINTLDKKNCIVKVTCIGYKTVYRNISDSNLGAIILKEESMTLGDVIVKSSLPKTRLRNGAFVTTVAGSILEKSGNISNLLDRIPNVTSLPT